MPVVAVPSLPPGTSRYAALAAALRERIVAGEWPPGTAMPAEDRLAGEHGVALGTLRRALELLADEGLIDRRHGRGTFVRSGLSGSTLLRFFRFGEDGRLPTSRIVSRQPSTAVPEVAQRLDLARGEPVLRLQRVRSLDGEPCLVEDLWLPLPAFDALAQGAADDWGDLLYPVYAERCGVHVHRAVDTIRFDVLGARHARLLGLAPGHPCACVERVARDVAGRAVEFRRTRGDAHAFRYSVTLT
ncbi:MAG TPA: GntR family transcriptional regulator [Burkholderiaceae bacterium]|nr:GntR family transcriptional regulator [Burkholderiaceae bacterium]